jgi:transposase InsO family protein
VPEGEGQTAKEGSAHVNANLQQSKRKTAHQLVWTTEDVSSGKSLRCGHEDAFTKYLELAAIPNQTEDQMAKVLFKRWFCRFSAPTVMVSDQGREFCNELVNRLCGLWDVDKRRTSPYHPQTNSSAESYNRSMKKYKTVMLDKKPTMDWEDLLPWMMLSYNCHVRGATGDSPFFLMFAHDPRLPFFDIEKPRMFYDSSYVSDM